MSATFKFTAIAFGRRDLHFVRHKRRWSGQDCPVYLRRRIAGTNTSTSVEFGEESAPAMALTT